MPPENAARDSWLRDARQAEVTRLFSYVVLAATLLLGEVSVWAALLSSKGHLPPPTQIALFVLVDDVMVLYFGLAAVARYDLVAAIEREMGYPKDVTALLSTAGGGRTTVASRSWLVREYVLFGSSPAELGADSWSIRRAAAWSPNRVVLTWFGIPLLLIVLALAIFEQYWPWIWPHL